MKKNLHPLRLNTLVAGLLAVANLALADNELWVGISGTTTTTNWSDTANWSGTSHNPNDNTVYFINNGPTVPGTVDNVVDTSTNCNSLNFTNASNTHTTLIQDGQTLKIDGNNGGVALNVNPLGQVMTTNTITGANGTLLITGGSAGGVFVATTNSSASNLAPLLDMSGLGNFIISNTAASAVMSIGNGANRSDGQIFLAKTNYLALPGTGTGNSAALVVGDNTSNNGSSPGGVVLLGQTNTILADNIGVGLSKQNGASVRFNPVFTNGGANPFVYIRGYSTTAVKRWAIGDGLAQSGTSAAGTGTVDFRNGTVNAVVTAMVLGRPSSTSTSSPNSAGTLSLSSGSISVVNLTNAMMTTVAGVGATPTNQTATATINVSGTASFSANNVVMAILLGSGGSSTANLNVNSGTLAVGTVSVGTGTSTITVNPGTFIATNAVGSPAAPLSALNVTNATVQLSVNGSGAITTNICVSTVNAGGTATFVIDQVIGVTGPMTFPLVAYSTLNGTVADNFAVTYPAGYTASLVDNAAQKRIDLSITPNVIIVPLVWTGATNSDWDLTTSNWTAAGVLATYTDASTVAFDDSASNATVNLTAAFAPASMTMSNLVLNYLFTGSGSIGSTNSLTLKATATTVLDNTGSNSFTGGISIAAGTLQVGNNDTKGNLPDGQAVVDNATLAFNRTDNHTNNSVITGTGTLAQNGSGTLTLAGANSYGATAITVGALQVGAGGASGTLGSGAVTDNGTLTFNRSDNVTVANVINGSGSVTKVNNNVLTLSASSGFSSGLTANAGTVRLSNTNAAGTGTITVNPGSTVVLGVANITNSVTLAGGTLAVGATQNPLKLELTAAASTTSTLLIADPASLGTGDATEVAFTNTGTWHGSGDVIVATVTNDAAADSGNGLRLRGLAASDFSGTITLSNNVKGELQTAVAGPFSPAGTGKIKLVCGSYLGNNTTTNQVTGVNNAYTELNLRNLSSGDTVLGNDVIVLGSGFTTLDPLGTAPAGTKITMGNLTIGNGQELGVYLSAAPAHVIVFPTVTLTGGTARFSPKTPGFGTVASVGSDLSFGNISESSPSSIVMNGVRTLTFTGTGTYSGSTTISNGVLALTGSATIANTTNILIAGGATLDVSGLSSAFTLGSSQTLSAIAATGNLAGNATLSAGAVALNYTNGTPTLSVTNGTLTLNNNPVTVTVVGTALPAGSYKIISTNTAGIVAGSVASSTVNILGAGVASGTLTTLAILTNELYLVVNHAPTANNVTYARGSVNSWQVPVANLLTNASDVDGDTLTLTSVGTSTNGITLAIGGGYVSYLNANLVDDQFSYTVADGKGGSATGTVTLVITPFASGQNATIAVTGSTATVGFAGIPGYKYAVQRSTNLVDWATIETTNAPSGGIFDVTDAFGDLGNVPATAYYRLLWNGN